MRHRLEALIDGIPLILAALIVFEVGATFAARVAYPYDLEWMEGGMLAHAWRLRQGLPLYVAPNPDFIPFIYPPGYSALLAALSSVVELDYPAGRVLSIGGTFASAAAIVFVAVRQSGSWLGGIAGAACFLGLYRASGGFYDLVRPDAVAVALAAWSVALAIQARRGAEVASGLLLAAAFLCKHNLASLGVPLVVALWIRGGLPLALRFTLASAGPALALTGILQLRSDGGFLTYLLEVPGAHPMLWDRLAWGTPSELGYALLPTLALGAGGAIALAPLGGAGWRWGAVIAPAVVCAGLGAIPDGGTWMAGVVLALGGGVAGAVIVSAAAPVGSRPSWRWWMAVGIGGTALLFAAMMRGHYGGFLNVLMPAHWVCSLGLGVGVGHLRQRWRTPWMHGLTVLVVAGQLAWLQRDLDTEKIRPTEADVAAGDALVAQVGALCPEGPILAPHFAWIPTRLGRDPSLHLIAVWDLNHKEGPYVSEVQTMMIAASNSHHWACVLQGTSRHQVKYGTKAGYPHTERLQREATRLRPKTGWRVSPAEVLLPEATP